MPDPKTQPSPGPIGPSSRSGCGWKVPGGCALGCAAAIGVVLLIVGGYLWWLLGPGTQHPTQAAAGPEATGAYQLRDLGEDEGARAALEEVVREVQGRSASRPGDEMPGWIPTDPGSLAGAIGKVMPREGTLAFERVPGRDEPAAVLALNLRGFTRPLRMMLENPDNRPETYRGMPVISPEGGDLDIAMVDGTLVLSDDPQALRAAIDRMLDGTGGPVGSRLEILQPPPEGAILSGGSSFGPGELSAMLRPEEDRDGESVKAPPIDPARFHGVERLELVVDGLDDRAIRFRLGVGGATPDQARQASAALDELLRRELSAADYNSTARTTGDVSVIDARITGWIEPFAGWFVADEEESPSSEALPSPSSDR
ncbi:MAG: hypothetical protein ACLF0P_14395 [Thermoanaerobaculia bacterium]